METDVNLSKSTSSGISLTKSSSSSRSSVSELDSDTDTNVIYQRPTNEASCTDENECKKSVSDNGSEEYVYRESFYIETKQVSTITEEIVHISNENVDGMSHAEYYKGLYQECKRQLAAAVKAADTKYTGIVQKYRDLEDNYNAMSLTSTNATEVKDKLIISLNKTVEEYGEKVSVLITEHESKIHEYEDMLSAKNKILSSQKVIIDAQSTSEKRLQNIIKGELDFRMKPSKKKASGKNINLSLYNCEGCPATFVDLIKCNLCSEYVCNGVTASKLKTAVQNCKTVYVICKKCEEANTTTNEDPWPTINIRPHIMHFRRLVFSYTE